MKKAIILLICYLFTFIPIKSFGENPELEEHYHEGIEFANNEQWSEAESQLTAFIEANKLSNIPLERLSKSFFKKFSKDSIVLFENAYYTRGYAREELGNKDGALEDFKRAVKIDPEDARAFYRLGYVLILKEQFSKAESKLKRAIELKKKNFRELAETYNARGVARFNLGNRDGALEDFRRAALIGPRYADAFNNIGHVLRLEKQYKKARTAIDHAISISSEAGVFFAEACYNSGKTCLDEGKISRAISRYKKILKHDPDHNGVHGDIDDLYNQGKTFIEAREFDHAVKYYKWILALVPDHKGVNDQINALYEKGNAFLEKGEFDSAIEFYNGFLQFFPNHEEALNAIKTAKDMRRKFNERLEIKSRNQNRSFGRKCLVFVKQVFNK